MSALGKTTEKEVEYTNYKVEKKMIVDGKISCIAQNMEKLISFSYGQNNFEQLPGKECINMST